MQKTNRLRLAEATLWSSGAGWAGLHLCTTELKVTLILFMFENPEPVTITPAPTVPQAGFRVIFVIKPRTCGFTETSRTKLQKKQAESSRWRQNSPIHFSAFPLSGNKSRSWNWLLSSYGKKWNCSMFSSVMFYILRWREICRFKVNNSCFTPENSVNFCNWKSPNSGESMQKQECFKGFAPKKWADSIRLF